MVKVLSVGGSIVVPDAPDTAFLNEFSSMIREWLAEDKSRKLILVVGGGAPARVYQNAYRAVGGNAKEDNQADWIGIMATRLNAQLLKAIFSDLCEQDVVYDPTAAKDFTGRILVAAGWKPGFSTDNDAVLLAEQFGAKTVVNLSNIEKVYTDDPKKNPEAKPLDTISWTDFRKMVGDEWQPGKNCPFDPIASKKAAENGMTVICAGGKNIPNIRSILNDQNFIGTKIG
ncbi:MAG: UMP kinase [Treponemataceae bacterium]|nr:UMP kinase [Treponemataceae bacterium]